MTVDIPHFDFPFRFSGSSAAVVEQDSMDEIADCCHVILSTPLGFRPEQPNFGSPDLAFKRLPIGEEDVHQLLSVQEPRVEFLISERRDLFADLVSTINIMLHSRGGHETT